MTMIERLKRIEFGQPRDVEKAWEKAVKKNENRFRIRIFNYPSNFWLPRKNMSPCNDHCQFGRMNVRIRQNNFYVTIISDTLKIINFKLCLIVALLELYPIIPLFSNLYCISRSQQCQTVSTEDIIFLAN